MTAALRFRNLTLRYDRQPAVHHLDGAIEAGALVAVVGRNGAGKSTLFKGIVGVIKPLAGRIERGDPNPQNIAYLPQAAEIDRTFPINVYDMVAMGLWRRAGSFGGIDRMARASIEQAIDAVGLSGFEAPRLPHPPARPDAADGVRPPVAAGRARHRARRAVQRSRCQALGRPVRSRAALAWRAAYRAHRHARYRFCAGKLSGDAALSARA